MVKKAVQMKSKPCLKCGKVGYNSEGGIYRTCPRCRDENNEIISGMRYTTSAIDRSGRVPPKRARI